MFYFLILALAAPIILSKLNSKYYSKKYGKIAIASMSAILIYCAIVITVQVIDTKLEAELYSHDLNGDRVFSGKERSPEQEEAMRKYTHDTGRTFAPFTGALFSFLYFLGVLGCWKLINSIAQYYHGKK